MTKCTAGNLSITDEHRSLDLAASLPKVTDPDLPMSFLAQAARSRLDVGCTATWITALLRSGRLGKTPAFVRVRDNDGDLTAYIPFMIRWRTRRKVPIRYAMPFSAVYSARCSLPVDPLTPDTMARALAAIQRRIGSRTILEMPVEMGGEIEDVLLKAASELGWTWRFTERGVCPYLPLTDGKDRYLAARSRNFRMNVKRKVRALEATHRVEIKLVTSQTGLANAFSDICAIERKSWKTEQGTAFTSRDDLLSLYHNITGLGCQEGIIRLYLLEIDSYPIAYDFGLLHENVYYMLKTSYRTQYASLSPGFILRWHVLCDLWSIGAIEHNFLWDRDAYKSQWASAERIFGTYWMYPPGLLQRPLLFWSR